MSMKRSFTGGWSLSCRKLCNKKTRVSASHSGLVANWLTFLVFFRLPAKNLFVYLLSSLLCLAALTIPIMEYVVPDLGDTPDSLSTTPSSTDLPPELTDKAAGSTEPTPSLKGEKSLKSALKFSKDSPRGD